MKISLFGDVCPAHNINFLLDKSILDADLSLLNLENPITESSDPVTKIGPNLKGSKTTLLDIRQQFPNKIFASLANNHIMDFGAKGVNDTIEICKKNDFLYAGVGTGSNIEPLIIEQDNNKIAIISICEKQFQFAQDNKLGVKCFTPEVYKLISELKKNNHFVIISIHQGAEYYRWPYPGYQDLLRSFIDIGADIIHGHHSHVPQGYEEYSNGLIFYGLGNFIVSPQRWQNKNNLWSITAHINIDNNRITDYKVIPCEIKPDSENNARISPVNDNYTKEYIQDCNLPLSNKKLLSALWQEFAVKLYEKSLIYILNHKFGKLIIREKYTKALKHLIKFLKGKEKSFVTGFLDHYKNLVYYHFMSCESHQAAIETALGVKSGEIVDLRDANSSKLYNKKYST